jgi:iron complex transport system ATP-binding protein
LTVVALDAVSVSLGGARVVTEVSAEIAPAEWVTLIGPNGAGKSTLLRAIAGLVPYEGSITLDGSGIAALGRRDLARRLAFVPQAPLLPPEMRVDEYVLLGRTPHIGAFGYESRGDLEAVGDALARLDLERFAARPLRTLSGGERQRVVLARALAQDAPLLLLDEPTAALDIGRQQQVLEIVAELRERGGLTIVSAMHDLTLAAQYADRLLLLSKGELVADGPPHEIVTEELISEHYGARVRVIEDDGFAVAVIPVRLALERDGARDRA